MSALSKLSNLQQRIITGVIGGGLVVFCISFNQWSYLILLLGISTIGQLEFYKLIKEDGNEPHTILGIINGVLFNLISFFVARGDLPPKIYFLFFVMLSIIYITEMYRKTANPFENISYTIVGIFYVAMPFALLHFASFSRGFFSTQIASGVFFLLWASDSGAYFAGKSLGKNKLFLRISPGKTWEGLAGGMLMSVIIALILGNYFHDLSIWKWVCLSIIIVVFGTFGDLVESMLKRSLQIKDSGQIIPGHGGILDRFDGMLMAAPFVVFFLIWF